MSKLTVARVIALALLTVAFLAALRTTSLTIDGTRYFWLDDDQMISMRYARNLAHGDGLVVLVVLLTLPLCWDFLAWAVNGFDTTVSPFTFLFVIGRLVEERESAP